MTSMPDPEIIRKRLEQELVSRSNQLEVSDPLRAAVLHAVFPGGKRIRPYLALCYCVDLGGDFEALLPAALALELVHCASLVHDDLPALDNDDYRRGRASCHRAFGEAGAILAGDLMVAWAFEFITQCALEDRRKLLLVDQLSRAFVKLCHGQQLDLSRQARSGSLDEIHALKTGALFGAAMFFGPVGAGLGEEEMRLSNELGVRLGVSFQIIDDLLDRREHAALKGRPESSDARNEKNSYSQTDSTRLSDTLSANRREIQAGLSKLGAARQQSLALTEAIVAEIFNRAPQLF